MFEQIVPLISKFCKFSAFSLKFQKFFSITRTIFLKVGQNNFGNKIPVVVFYLERISHHCEEGQILRNAPDAQMQIAGF
jgi:hypothetical protein